MTDNNDHAAQQTHRAISAGAEFPGAPSAVAACPAPTSAHAADVLLPCPFCGKSATLYARTNGYIECGCESCYVWTASLKDGEAVKLWNCLAPLSTSAADAEATHDRRFEYLLNAFEHAAQDDCQFDKGYAGKRAKVFEFVQMLQRENEEFRRTRYDWKELSATAIAADAPSVREYIQCLEKRYLDAENKLRREIEISATLASQAEKAESELAKLRAEMEEAQKLLIDPPVGYSCSPDGMQEAPDGACVSGKDYDKLRHSVIALLAAKDADIAFAHGVYNASEARHTEEMARISDSHKAEIDHMDAEITRLKELADERNMVSCLVMSEIGLLDCLMASHDAHSFWSNVLKAHAELPSEDQITAEDNDAARTQEQK